MILTVYRRPKDYLIPGWGTLDLDGYHFLPKVAQNLGAHTLMVWSVDWDTPAILYEEGDAGEAYYSFPTYQLITALSLDPNGGN